MRTLAAILVGLALAGAGCEKRHYELELTPQDGALKRQLTGHVEASGQGQPQLRSLNAEELARIAALYGQKTPQGGGPKHSFEGTFAGRMPDDIGGHGTYVDWASEFGTARLYVERFRGDDDFVGTLDKCREAVKRITDLLVVWVDETWVNQPERLAIRQFVDHELRRDLENVAYYLKAAELVGSEGVASDDQLNARIKRDAGDISARISQYLVERQYVELAQLPRLTRILQELDRTDGHPALMQLLQETVRRKIGIAADEPLPASLALFADESRLLKSLNDSLRNSDEYRAKLAAWEQTPVNDRSELPEEPLTVLGDILAEKFGVVFLLGRLDELVATMHAATKPIASNGTWDETRKVITWKRRLTADKESSGIAPEILYAVWTDTDDKSQTKHFGKVTLRDDALFGYCMWRNSLTQTEARQWSKFLASLRPEDSFQVRLEMFRFEGEPEEVDDASRSSRVRELLLDVIGRR